MEPVRAPFITYRDSLSASLSFIKESSALEGVPLDVELLVEKKGIDIVPIHNLKHDFDIDGFLSGDHKEIYVDEQTLEKYPRRHRFTVAHELGHLIHHSTIYCESSYNDLLSYAKFLEDISGDDLHWLEKHADNFAGCLLVPSEQLIAYSKKYLSSETKLSEKIARAKSAGFSEDQITDYIAEIISKNIATVFDVTDIVVKIRLIMEGLMPSLIGDF